jgi:hypothetical protein
LTKKLAKTRKSRRDGLNAPVKTALGTELSFLEDKQGAKRIIFSV